MIWRERRANLRLGSGEQADGVSEHDDCGEMLFHIFQ